MPRGDKDKYAAKQKREPDTRIVRALRLGEGAVRRGGPPFGSPS
jgi:hypothetical protein